MLHYCLEFYTEGIVTPRVTKTMKRTFGKSQSFGRAAGRHMHLTPRSRKNKVVERQRKVEATFTYAPTPGPGSYEPRRPTTTTAKFAGSAAFKSASSNARQACYLREMGDPGSYDPYSHLNMGSQSARSFNRTQQSGTGRFGSGSKRGEFATGIGPGAAGYMTRPNWVKNGRKLSPGFATKSTRSDWVKPKSQSPNPGVYNPQHGIKLAEKRTQGGDSIFRNRTPRFTSKEEEARVKQAPGPGHYSARTHTLAHGAKEKMKSMRTYTSTRADLFRPPRVRVYV